MTHPHMSEGLRIAEATPPVDAPVQLVVELRVRPGAQDRARESLARLVSATHREDDGCVRFEVGVDELDDTRFVGYEVWASQDALDRHANQPHTQAFLEEARAFATDPDAPLTVSRWLPVNALRAADYRPPPTRPSTPAPPPAGFEHRDAEVGGVRLHYVIGGAGDPVVLLHGFPNSWYAWRDVMPALGARHTVIAVDLRGLGDSDRPGHGYDMQATSQDIAGLVDQLGLGPVFLAGQDWGGSTAFALTAAHPERVRALAVLEAMPAGPWSGQDAKAGPWFAAFHQIHGLPETLVAGREDEYLAWFYDAFSASPGVPTAAAVDEYMRTYSAPGAMHAAFERYRGVPEEIRYNGQPGKTPLTLPVLAVGGEHLFGAAVAENLRAAATDVREVVLPGCSHYLSEERPDDVAQLLLDFFAGERSFIARSARSAPDAATTTS